MVEINLLPWRKTQQQHNEKVFKRFVLASVLCAGLVLALSHCLITAKIKHLNEEITSLKNKMQPFTQWQRQSDEVQKRDVEDQGLQKTLVQYQSNITAWLDTLIHIPINQVCFSEMTRKKNSFVFSGFAHSIRDLEVFIKRDAFKNFFSEMTLQSLSKKPSAHAIHFLIQATEKEPLTLDTTDTEKGENAAI
jgi:Tfp pilus assembly protein PilN